ncbi:condensation domain-containing protein [Kitasatospora mediocidica]|uniref:condensation domain-containing protein n=1 Tax=Kitasatospora mediocidica TaxID=58352 RepID=UPI0006925A6D|nr:condensation domain-containing protein [Kitasatospora mediocidica]
MTQTIGRFGADRDFAPTTPAPMSFAQEQLWLLHQLLPEPQAYNVPGAFLVRGDLDPGILTRTLTELALRHEPLRTALVEDDGELFQEVLPADEFRPPLEWHDLRALAPAEREARRRDLSLRESSTTFALDRAPLWRAVLLRTAEREHVLLLTMHHAITDGWSLELLLREICLLHPAVAQGLPSPLAPLAFSQAGYARRQRERLAAGGLDRERAYWRGALAGAPATMPVLAGRERPAKPTYRGDAVQISLPAELHEGVLALGRRLRASPFMVYLAAFKALIHRYTGGTDLLVGTPVAGRSGPEEEQLVGYFVNSLPLRTDVSGSPTFEDLVRRVRGTALNALDHQELPFEEIVRELAGSRGITHHPVFQTLFALTRLPARWEGEGITIEPVEVTRNGTAKFDLSLMLYESGQGLRGALEFSADLFDHDRIERLAAHWTALLAAVLADPGLRVDGPELPSPDPADRPEPAVPPVAPAVPSPGEGGGEASRQVLHGIWCQVLGVPELAPDDDFFELGGHSLLAIRITARASAAFDVDLPMTALFQNPTLARFSAAVDAAVAEAEADDALTDTATDPLTSEGTS